MKTRPLCCQYASCLETVGDNGVAISLRTADSYGYRKAHFCCALHAALSLTKLAQDRRELTTLVTGIGEDALGSHWRVE